MWRAVILFVATLPGASGLDNGLALTPPMGWRSWNCYHGEVDDQRVRTTIDAVTSRSRNVDGVPTSLADLGYAHVGVDDGWQACQTGKDCSFHADDGRPLVNASKFPDLKALVKYGDQMGALVGWYQINCICCDEFTDTDDTVWKKRVYKADVQQLLEAGFHGVKLDNCGDDVLHGAGFIERVAAINASGTAMLIENSNQGFGGPGAKPHNARDNPISAEASCPFNLFRTGGDIVPDFGVVIDKLQSTVPYLGNATFPPISRPGCWAYPDMLEVGNFAGDATTAYMESRTHFGAWCIVSSPLILGFDLTDSNKMDAIWDIITNTEAIQVNQQWAGQPGRLVDSSSSHQVWAKQLPKGDVAVLVLNRGQTPINISVDAALILPSLKEASVARSIWSRSYVSDAVSGGALRISFLAAHDSVFYRFSTGAATAPTWWPASAVSVVLPTDTRSMTLSARAACERIQGVKECASLTPCEQQCVAAGRCCTDTTSGFQHPSCAQGCIVAQHTTSLLACEAACDAADGKCNWSIDSIEMTNCQSCPKTCCNAVVPGECKQGCGFAFGRNNTYNILI